MKKILYATFAFSLFLSACGRRNIPSKSVESPKLHPRIAPDRVDQKQYVKRATIVDSARTVTNPNQQNKVTDSYTAPEGTTTTDSATVASSASSLSEPVVVIDSRGKLMIDTLNLPATVSHNLDSLNQTIRAFTPDEAKNLAFRFKQIPPRVLFVPDQLAKKGRKGYYYKYNDKFWYWKKADGYFYLDENYYK